MIFERMLLVVTLLACFQTQAQEVEFGNVSKEELKETSYSLDSDASAAVTFRKQETYLLSSNGILRLITEVHERIKIYNKDGFEYATEKVNLFKAGSDKEQIKKIKAFTYNLENGKVVESELDRDQIFDTKMSFNYDQVKFTMPNVKEGSVIEFSYRIESPFVWNIDEFRFQRDIPVKHLMAELRTPKGFNFRQTQKGFIILNSKKTTKQDHRLGMEVVITSYDLKNIPAMKAENYVDNIDNYRSGAMFELVSIDIPGTPYRSYAQTWEDVAKTIGSSSDYKNNLDKTRSFKEELKAILGGKTDQLQIAKDLFKYVKNQTEWNGLDGKSFQNGIKKTLKEKKGNAADINLLLVAMMRDAGIRANPVILSTKDNSLPFFPTVDRLNFVIAHAFIDGKNYYMDATEEFSDINLLPVRDYNWGGLLVDNHNKVWKHITAIKPKKANNIYALDISLDTEGYAEGSFKSRLSDHSAYRFRENFKNRDSDEYLNEMEQKYLGIEISDYEAGNTDTYEGMVTEKFVYETENGADVVGDKLYVHPMAFLRMKENPFKLEKREYPIDFGFPFKDRYLVNIKLPQGYIVESMPENVLVHLPNELGSYKYVVKKNAAGIQLSVTFDLNSAIISATNYSELKEYYNQIIIKGSEQVVLARASNEHNQSTAGSR